MKGVDIIKKIVEDLPFQPGVYRMVNGQGHVLYIGKAKSLKKRVASYTELSKLPVRLQRMVCETASMEIVLCPTETQALLLENDYIKKYQPKYNILLKDDKSFPYIVFDESHEFPRFLKFRGHRKKGFIFFGPFPHVQDVLEIIDLLEKTFLLRSCSDHEFLNRSRPCLKYQIKRCSAPCVGLISQIEYGKRLQEIKEFFLSQGKDILDRLRFQIDQAREQMDYEKALFFRDRYSALQKIRLQQSFISSLMHSIDVIGYASCGDRLCLNVFFMRKGRNSGNKSFLIHNTLHNTFEEMIARFLLKFYEKNALPEEIIFGENREDFNEKQFIDVFEQLYHTKVRVVKAVRNIRQQMQIYAQKNAYYALEKALDRGVGNEEGVLQEWQALLQLENFPQRIEVYDNSHIQGQFPVGGMIVAGENGFMRPSYRKFYLSCKTGDDYAMMREVFFRRFQGAEKDIFPDIILLDGGKGQLNAVQEVLDTLTINVPLMAIAKGVERDKGEEILYSKLHPQGMRCDKKSPLLNYLQRLRDEAHRFVIGAHRQRRHRAIKVSQLDNVPFIGNKRKKLLLNHFGGLQAIREASLQELLKVEGINKRIAQTIHDYFQNTP